ncbi:MAG: GTPase Era [Pseudomonadota bacterium]|nr:GTPase Era [Pseudomonadota bacterium]
MADEYFGYVAIIGRPNVGKSTMFNALLGRSISIVTRKAQTTQSKIMGVVTTPPYQYVMLDTPGVQTRLQQRQYGKLNKIAKQAAYEADAAIFMVEGLKWRSDDAEALKTLEGFTGPVIAVVNKYDRYTKKMHDVQAYVDQLQTHYAFEKVVLASAEQALHMDLVQDAICEMLPEGAFLYPVASLTSHSDDFILAEILRSKLLMLLHEEVPYMAKTEIEIREDKGKHWLIYANIWVPSSSKKAMVIGKRGEKLKQIGIQARSAMRAYLQKEVVLKTWVKIGDPDGGV